MKVCLNEKYNKDTAHVNLNTGPKQRLPPSVMKRILLIRTDRIGDTVLTLPAATALKAAFPEVQIRFLARNYTEPLVRLYQDVDEVLVYEPEGRHRGWSGHRVLAQELREGGFDAALLFLPRPELALALRWAGIPVRIGSGFRWYSFLLTHTIKEHRKTCKKHEADYNHSLLRPLLGEALPPVKFAFRPFQVSSATEPTYAILHPGSGQSAPNLSVEQYRVLIAGLLVQTPWDIRLTGTAEEIELSQQLAAGFPENRVQNLAGQHDLGSLFECIAGTQLLITSSTGPLHLANAINTPTLSFFCPARPHTPKRWGPYHQQEWVVAPDLAGFDWCQQSRCPYGGCLSELSAEAIRQALERRLNGLLNPEAAIQESA